MATTLGERIKQVREELGLKPVEFAREIGVKQPSLWDLENGETKNPSAETLQRMKERYGVSPDYIMRARGPKFLDKIEAQLEEQTILAMLRELDEENRAKAIDLIKMMRRAQGGGPSPNDPRLAAVTERNETDRYVHRRPAALEWRLRGARGDHL
jgi:transcriptional regulator with XRE-family HTH domain